jgi:hypothetical protein
MATIPQGNFGQAVARPMQGIQIAGSSPLTEAGTRAAQTGMAMEIDRAQAETAFEEARVREEQKSRDRAEAAQTMAATAEAQADLRRQRDEFSQGVLTGQIDKTKAAELWDTQSRKFVSKFGSSLPTSRAEMAAAHLLDYSLQMGDGVRKSVQVKDKTDTRAGLLGYLDGMEREALTDRPLSVARAESAIDQLGPFAGLGADDAQQLKQSFREKAAFNVGSTMVRGARDDMGTLDQVLGRIGSKEFSDLTPERRGQLEQQVLARKQYLLNQEQTRIARSEALTARHDREAEGAFKATQGLIDGGAVPDIETLEAAQVATRGTPYAAALQTLVGQANERAGFASLTPTKQQSTLLALRSKANAEGSSPLLEKRLKTFEEIASKQEHQIEKDPLVWGHASRLLDRVQPLSFENMDQLAASMSERVDQARTVSAALKRPVSPLLAMEANRVAEILGGMPLAQKTMAVRNLAGAMPPEQQRALAAQISEKSPALSLSMFAATQGQAAGVDLPELLLRGEDARRAGRIKPAAEDAGAKEDARRIARELDKVQWLTPKDREAATQASLLVYDAQRDLKGSSGWKKAVTAAVGELAEWGDSTVPVPPGWSESRFRSAMHRMDAAAVERQANGPMFVNGAPVPAEAISKVLPSAMLIPLGAGRYGLSTGGAMVTLGNRRPFVIDLDKE